MKFRNIALSMLIFLPAVSSFAQSYDREAIIETINCQIRNYPKSTLKDLYKNFFQDKFGPGHIINDTKAAENYLNRELNSITGISTGPVAEPTGWEHNFYRVNLSVIKSDLIPYDIFLDAFVRSINGIKPITIEEWKNEWKYIHDIIISLNIELEDYENELNEINGNLEKGIYVGHHSEIFNKEYNPHYRIISKEILETELSELLFRATDRH